MKPIQVRTEPPESDHEVVFLLIDGKFAERHYGEVGSGPYVLRSDIIKALRSAEPRADEDLVAFIEATGVRVLRSDDNEWRAYDRFGRHHFRGHTFGSWREVVDALIDLNEEV